MFSQERKTFYLNKEASLSNEVAQLRRSTSRGNGHEIKFLIRKFRMGMIKYCRVNTNLEQELDHAVFLRERCTLSNDLTKTFFGYITTGLHELHKHYFKVKGILLKVENERIKRRLF